MIVTSRDYNFHELLDYRFTQYRCPVCQSFHVAVRSLARIADGHSRMVIGRGEMICLECRNMAMGHDFEQQSQAYKLEADYITSMNSVIGATGDIWIDLRERRIEDF